MIGLWLLTLGEVINALTLIVGFKSSIGPNNIKRTYPWPNF